MTHTLKFTAVQQKSASFSGTTAGEAENDVNKAGKIIGFDVIYIVFNPKTHTASGGLTLDTNGGFLYGTLEFTNSPVTHGKVTGGTGRFKGATGTITGKDLNKSGTPEQGRHGAAAAPAECLNGPVVRRRHGCLPQAPLHLGEVLAHRVSLGEEHQRLGLNSAHAKTPGGGQGKPGVAGRLAELEPPVVCGRQLKIQHGGGAEGAGFGGGAASVAQAFGPAELEQLDGAQLVQCPQPPERKVPGLGDGQGALKRAARRVQVVQPRYPADHLQRLAPDFGTGPGRVQSRVRQLPGLRDIIAGQGQFRAEHRDMRAALRVRIRRKQPLRRLNVRAGGRPAGRRDRGARQPDVNIRRSRPRGAGIRPGGYQPLADSHGLVRVPRQCQASDQQAFGTGAGSRVGEHSRRAPQRVSRGSQRAAVQRRLARRGEQRSGALELTCLGSQIGGHLTPPAFQFRMRRIDRGQRRGGQGPPPGRQQPRRHGLAGQRMPEPEHLTIHGQQLAANGALEGPGHETGPQSRGHPQQLPVEMPAEHRGRLQHKPLIIGEASQPRPDHTGERLRHARRGQHLLHQERHTLGRALHPGDQLIIPVNCASPHHQRNLVVPQAAQRNVLSAAPALQPARKLRRRGRRLAPARGHAQDTLARQVVGKVLHHGKGVRIRPMQVFQSNKQPARHAEPTDQPDHRLATGHRGSIAILLTADPGQHRPQRRQPRRQASVARQRAIPQDLQQGLRQRPVRRARLGGHRPAGHRQCPATGRVASQLTDQPGLTDSGLARDKHQGAFAARRTSKRVLQQAQLIVPPDHHRAQRHPHTLSLSRGNQQRNRPP